MPALSWAGAAGFGPGSRPHALEPALSEPTPALLDPVARGWSAADIDPAELVTDDWIRKNTRPGRRPSKLRHAGGRALAAARTVGVDPLEGSNPADLTGLLPRLPRAVRRTLVQRGGLTRDQLRRIAARTGYPYVEAWSGHNKGGMAGVWGAMVHHTGTPWTAAGDYPTLRVVRDGRPGLENSLCAFGLGRSGTIYLISEKLSWHAGAGNWNGMTNGNGLTYGIEAESDGKNWTDAERDCYPRLVASILVEIGEGDRYTTRHGSYALPRGRKTDASGLDMDRFWREVYAYLANPPSIHKDHGKAVAPPPAPIGSHTVTAGQTLWSISRLLGVSVADLKAWNGLTSDTLRVGQVLRVNGGAPAPAPPTDRLEAGGVLRPGQALRAGGFTAAMQTDGNFVVYDGGGRALWSTRTNGNPGAWLVLQTDGNLVLYRADGRVLWSTRTNGKGGRVLIMQLDANLVLYNAAGRAIWARR